MPRFFFDIHDGRRLFRDVHGSEFTDRAAIRAEAMQVLPDIACDEIPRDGDRQAYTVLVRNEQNVTIYTATITFAGLWIDIDFNAPTEAG